MARRIPKRVSKEEKRFRVSRRRIPERFSLTRSQNDRQQKPQRGIPDSKIEHWFYPQVPLRTPKSNSEPYKETDSFEEAKSPSRHNVSNLQGRVWQSLQEICQAQKD